MLFLHFCLIFSPQMQVLGTMFQVYSRTSESLQPDAKADTTEHLRSVEMRANLTQDHAKDKITHPVGNLAHGSSSRNAKGFWNAFLFRGKSDRTILPIRNHEIRQGKCRAITFSQRISHESCETLEIKNKVCFGKCTMTSSDGEDSGSSCPVCSPVIFSSKTVKLTCVDNTHVLKVFTLIEDCRCESKEEAHVPHIGPVLVDQYP